MHLTNYAINKHSEDFIRDDEAGSKRYVNKKCFSCLLVALKNSVNFLNDFVPDFENGKNFISLVYQKR